MSINKEDNTEEIAFNLESLKSVKGTMSSIIRDNKEMMDFLPPLELASDILTSSILTPNEANNLSLNYYLNNKTIPTMLKNDVLSYVKDVMENKYDLLISQKEKLTKSLVTEGAYPVLVLRKDFLIDKTNSKILKDKQSKTYKEKHPKIDKEEKVIEEKISFGSIDDLFTKEIAIIDMEEENKNIDPNTLIKLLNTVFKEEDTNDILKVDEQQVSINEHAFVKHWPADSVIPIHHPKRKDEHVMYLLLTDKDNQPITQTNKTTIQALKKYYKDQNRKSINETKIKELENMSKYYEELQQMNIDEMLVKKGVLYHTDQALMDTINNILLNRLIDGHQTKIIVVKPSNLVYYAFDYRENGTGKSILEKTRVYVTLVSLLLLSTVSGKVLSSLPSYLVNVKLDDEMADEVQTIAKIRKRSFDYITKRLPLDSFDVNNFSTWLQQAGIAFKITGGSVPELDVNVERQEGMDVPDNEETITRLLELIYYCFYLTANIIESSKESDFATTELLKNSLYLSRIAGKQQVMNKFNSKLTRTIIMNDTIFYNGIKKKVRNNFKSVETLIKEKLADVIDLIENVDDDFLITWYTDEIINMILVELPKPLNNDDKNLSDAFGNFTDDLDSALDGFFSKDSLPESMSKEFGSKIDDLRYAFKNQLLRDWLHKNNYLEGLNNAFGKDENGNITNNIFLDVNEWIDRLSESYDEYLTVKKKELKKLKKVNKKDDKINESVENDEPTPVPDNSSAKVDKSTQTPDESNEGGTKKTKEDKVPNDKKDDKTIDNPSSMFDKF